MRYVYFRIFLLSFFVGAALGFPVYKVYQEIHDAPKVAKLDVPTLAEEGVGNSFPIAGQDPVPADGIILKAPDICEIGELVRFDARDSTVNLTWQILPATNDFEVVDQGKRAFFTSRIPGSYLVIIAGAKEDVPYLVHHTIVVEGDFEPGPVTLAQKVSGWVAQVEDYEGKDIKAAALADVFRSLATKEEVSVDDMLEATAVANSAVLGDDLEKWVPFLEALGNELDAYVEEGELDTRADYREIWLLIAKGIERSVPKAAIIAFEDTKE